MRKHPRRLADAGITPARYQELQGMCLQYPDDARRLRDIRAGIVDKPEGRPSAWKRPDPVGNAAARIADDTRYLSGRVRLIEDCAQRCAEPPVARAVLKSVTEGQSYQTLTPPCGVNQFYDCRLWFFVLLDAALKNQ